MSPPHFELVVMLCPCVVMIALIAAAIVADQGRAKVFLSVRILAGTRIACCPSFFLALVLPI